MTQTNTWQNGSAAHSSIARALGRRVEPSQSMSMRFWRLDWSAHLPFHLDGLRADQAGSGEVLPFVREHYPSIFAKPGVEGQFLSSPMTDAKRRFFDEMDFFVLRAGGDDAGVVMGHPSDWSTYYIRSVAVLPAFRGRRAIAQLTERLYAPLAAVGVERIEIETSPANVAMTRVLAGQGFMVTATASSERWGMVLRYTKFLSADAQAAFLRQYTSMTFAQRSRPSTNA